MMRRHSDLPPTDPQPWSSLVPADSFYARLCRWRDVLVDDEDYTPLYKDSPRGRPSVPPSMVVLAMLLQYHYDAEAALDLIERQQETVGLLPKELLCDGAYGSADVRADLQKLGVEVVAKMRPLTDGKHFRKDEFEIDLLANDAEGSVTCPAGVTPRWIVQTRQALSLRAGGVRRCELKERCLGGLIGRVKRPVRQPPGRQVQLHYHEEVIQKARAEQKTAEQKRALRERLRPRAKVERKISEVLNCALRRLLLSL